MNDYDGSLIHGFKRTKKRYMGGLKSDGLNLGKATDGHYMTEDNSVGGERVGLTEMDT